MGPPRAGHEPPTRACPHRGMAPLLCLADAQLRSPALSSIRVAIIPRKGMVMNQRRPGTKKRGRNMSVPCLPLPVPCVLALCGAPEGERDAPRRLKALGIQGGAREGHGDGQSPALLRPWGWGPGCARLAAAAAAAAGRQQPLRRSRCSGECPHPVPAPGDPIPIPSPICSHCSDPPSVAPLCPHPSPTLRFALFPSCHSAAAARRFRGPRGIFSQLAFCLVWVSLPVAQRMPLHCSQFSDNQMKFGRAKRVFHHRNHPAFVFPLQGFGAFIGEAGARSSGWGPTGAAGDAQGGELEVWRHRIEPLSKRSMKLKDDRSLRQPAWEGVCSSTQTLPQHCNISETCGDLFS